MDRIVMRVHGLLLERFLDLALAEGAHFREVRREGPRALRLTMRRADARVVRALAERFSLKTELISARGPWQWMRAWKARAGILAGILAGCALLIMFLGRIWVIDVTSADGSPREAGEIYALLAELGATPGVSARALDCSQLSLRMQAEMPTLTYVGLRVQGVRLKVEVAFEEAAPEVYDLEAGRDLVASRDAVIVRVDALAGKAAVKPGDTVRAGQVLIRGEERVSADATRGVRALGEVVARIWLRGDAGMATTRTGWRRTGETRVSSEVRLLDWSLPMTEAEDFERQQTEETRLPIGGLFLPLQIVRTTRYAVEAVREEINLEEAHAVVGEKAMERARAQLPDGAEVADQWTTYEVKDGALWAVAIIEARCDIAVERVGRVAAG